MNLLETWKKWSEQDPLAVPDFGYALEDDAKFLRDNHRKWQKKLFTYKDWKESNTGEKFGGNRLHLGLVPNSFMGDVENASIYVLMANPRTWPALYTDRDLSGVNKEFLANARQDFTGMEVRFSSLADQSDRSGYWHRRLWRTIERIEKEKKLSYFEAFKQVANKLAAIQLSPYWSRKFVGGAEKLPSSKLAVDYVKDSVVPRVLDGNAILIVMRRLNDWKHALPGNFEEVNGITIDKNRYAWVTPNTKGGKAILEHFGIDTDS